MGRTLLSGWAAALSLHGIKHFIFDTVDLGKYNNRRMESTKLDDNRAYLSLGSNLGDRAFNMRQAVEDLDSHPRITVVRQSSMYETEPVGVKDQPAFLNNAVQIRTGLTPNELLEVTKSIEDQMGRVRTFRWGPRVIDIDILAYNGMSIDSEELVIPHPKMLERAFVLAPLMEIAPDLELPGGIRVSNAYHSLPDDEKATVRRLGRSGK